MRTYIIYDRREQSAQYPFAYESQIVDERGRGGLIFWGPWSDRAKRRTLREALTTVMLCPMCMSLPDEEFSKITIVGIDE